MPARHDSAPFYIIYELILNGWNMKFRSFETLKNARAPFSNLRKTMSFVNVCLWHFKLPRKVVLENPRSGNNSPTSNLNFQPTSCFFHIDGKMDLEKLIWTPSISAQLPETFDLLWAKPFENLVFRLQAQGGKVPDFQTPPPAPPDEFSNPDPGPS